MSPSEAGARHLRAACFDLDGVVVDSEPLHYKAEKEALARHGIDLTLEAKAEFVGYPLHEVAVRMAARFGLPDAEAFHRALPKLLRKAKIAIHAIDSPGEDLEALYEKLVGGEQWEA